VIQANRKTHARAGKWKALPLGALMLLFCAVVASGASYLRTTLKEMTTASSAVVEVEVLRKEYPQMKPGETFPRTYVNVKVLKTLKGALPEVITLDTPGGINGNVVSYVPDAADFRVGEHAMVFVKEPQKGRYMVQDLGLGKFNITVRGNKKFVESPICSRAFNVQEPKDQKDLEANLLTRSIPYDTFCEMVTSYATGASTKDAALLAATLPASTSHLQSSAAPAVVADVLSTQQAERVRQAWLLSAFSLTFVALLAALIIARRRKLKAAKATSRTIALLLGTALSAGALGGMTANAFVQFDQKTIWDLDKTVLGKVEGQQIIWKQSTSVSKTNANPFPNVQGAFDKWEAVDRSRLAFTLGGTTQTAVNNSTDGENVVGWTSNPSDDFSKNTLAICFSSFTVGSSSNFVDCDIIFNDRDFSWNAGGSGNISSVALHEIGHFIGLNHTTVKDTVMFPFDGGLTSLSSDEVIAAQTMYAGPADPPSGGGGGTPPPAPPSGNPSVTAAASPDTGVPDLTVTLSSEATLAPSGAAISSFEWDFGDGSPKGSGQQVVHTYTSVGTFTATVRVTDANGASAVASVEISVGKNYSVTKAQIKMNFQQLGKDNVSATLFSDKLIGIRAPKGTGGVKQGSVLIGDQEWLFDFDTEKLATVNKQGPKIKVNDKTGSATLSVKNADLRDVLGGHGLVENLPGETVTVPVTFWFGPGSNLYLFGEIQVFFVSNAKTGSGKF